MKSMQPELRRGIVLFESRKSPREYIEIPLLYSIRGDDEDYIHQPEDIIDGGILIYVKDNLHIGTNLDTEIFPPEYCGLKSIKAITKIVWAQLTQLTGPEDVDGYEYGLTFIDMDDNNILRFKKLLKYLD